MNMNIDVKYDLIRLLTPWEKNYDEEKEEEGLLRKAKEVLSSCQSLLSLKPWSSWWFFWDLSFSPVAWRVSLFHNNNKKSSLKFCLNWFFSPMLIRWRWRWILCDSAEIPQPSVLWWLPNVNRDPNSSGSSCCDKSQAARWKDYGKGTDFCKSFWKLPTAQWWLYHPQKSLSRVVHKNLG